jgi:hypothetical protein
MTMLRHLSPDARRDAVSVLDLPVPMTLPSGVTAYHADMRWQHMIQAHSRDGREQGFK